MASLAGLEQLQLRERLLAYDKVLLQHREELPRQVPAARRSLLGLLCEDVLAVAASWEPGFEAV